MATTLPRLSLTKLDDPLVAARADLARQAATILGYNHLADRTITKAPDSLAAALIAADISPLSTTHVEAYKASKEHKSLLRPSTWKTLALIISWVAISATTIYCFHANKTSWLCGPLCAVTAIFGIIMLVGFMSDGSEAFFPTVPRTATFWRRIPISQYNVAIPEHILSKAIALKAVCPSVEFHIDHLMRGPDPTDRERIDLERRLRDPFLVATLGGTKQQRGRDRWGDPKYVTIPKEIFYIDVWDEREYESTL